MEILLIRHAQSEGNAGISEDLDSTLTPLGRLQAEATAERLFTVNGRPYIVVSPFNRTLATAAPLCARHDLPAHIEVLICEFMCANDERFHRFAGLGVSQVARDYPFAIPGPVFGTRKRWWPDPLEDSTALIIRATYARDALLAQSGNVDRLLVFSHLETIGRLIEAFLGVAPDPDHAPWTDNCGITTLLLTDRDSPAELVKFNDTTHLQFLGID